MDSDPLGLDDPEEAGEAVEEGETGVADPLGRAPSGLPLAGPFEADLLGPLLAGPRREDRSLPVVDGRRLVRRAEAEEDPYAAPGLRFGTFVLRPSIDVGVVATDNAGGGPGRNPAAGTLIAPQAQLRSDWSRHEAALDLRGTATESGDPDLDAREFAARAAGRYDISRRTSVDAAATYAYALDDPADADTPEGAAERPGSHVLGLEAGATHRFNRVGLDARGTLTRSLYADAALAGGGTADQGDRDTTALELRLRGTYRASGTLEPFVEAAAGRTIYDEGVDASGYRRSGRFQALSGGLIIDRAPKLQGEVSLGYRRNAFEDPRLMDHGSLAAAASLLWSPHRLTDLRLEVATGQEATTLAGASGILVRSAALTLTRRMRANLTGEAGLGVTHRNCVGIARTDVTFAGFAAAEYDLNRYAALIARYDYERTDSTEPLESGQVQLVSLRLRLKR